MDSNKKYIYTMLLQNSESYWKFLLGYFLMLLFLLTISEVCYEFSASLIILALIYIVSLWIATMYVMIYFLKKLLTENSLLNWKIVDTGEKLNVEKKQMNDNNIDKLLGIIQEQLINYWYNTISRDETFPKECKIIIENTMKHFSDTMSSTDKSYLTYVIGNIVLRHLKEFRRTSKLKEKSGSKLSEIYRYSFGMMPTNKTKEYYAHQMTKNLLVNFIHWELWNSLPCQVVISIISNKLANLIDVCANPEFINYYLLGTCISKEQREDLNLDKFSYVKIEIGPDKNECQNKKTSYLFRDENLSGEISPDSVEHNDIVETCAVNDEPVCTSADCIFVQKSSTHPELSISKAEDISYAPYEDIVKVHVPKSATKTWNEVLDLESISFGEDPLRISLHDSDVEDFLTFETSGADTNMTSLNNNNKTLLEEVKHITSMEGLKNTMKPLSDATASTLRDIKDFQENTVNTVMKPMSQATSQALHKIGDLQDEAAGVVEGLFDFGMAGIRKGLKLTGLQENSVQGTPSETKSKHMLSSPSTSHKKNKRHSKGEVAEECIWVNPLQHNPNFEDDEDPVKLDQTPSITMDSSEYESPDPEYEEAADLASTIAKLRSLLQQRSESTATTPVASPMIADDNKSVIDLDEADSFVPSFYKLAKTATGVFNNTLNTIKTALPVNGNEIVTYEIEKWDYEDYYEKGTSILSRMNKLAHDRKDFCMIEAAYDAFDSQQLPEENKHILDINYQDELDEFESRIPLAKTVIDIICELIMESDTLISQEPFVRFILAVFGQSFDNVIAQKVEDFLNTISITEVQTRKNNEVLTMNLDVFVDYLISGIPDALTFLFGHSTLQDALNLLVSSVQIRKCNQDVILQIFEFISLRLMEESSRNESVYSA